MVQHRGGILWCGKSKITKRGERGWREAYIKVLQYSKRGNELQMKIMRGRELQLEPSELLLVSMESHDKKLERMIIRLIDHQ